MIQRLKDIPWYPIPIGVYPALSLLSVNLGQIRPDAAWRSLAVSTLFGALLYFALWLFLRNAKRAAILCLSWLALLYSYGHIHVYIMGRHPAQQSWLPPIWTALAVMSLVWAVRQKETASPAALNAASLLLLTMPILQIALGTMQSWEPPNLPNPTGLSRPAPAPDVYYFILDSYGRADTLQAAYGYDNRRFLYGLAERGFRVAECSQSNYARTELSMASSLNMDYLWSMGNDNGPPPRRALWKAIQHSAVRRAFEGMGYKTVGFATGFAWNEWTDADTYIAPAQNGLNEFEIQLLQSTPMMNFHLDGGRGARDRFNAIFDSLGVVVEMPEATFAYIHIIPPHPPFVFDSKGRAVDPERIVFGEKMAYGVDEYARGYTAQLSWVNEKMLEAIDTLRERSTTAPIIVVQGDHGPWGVMDAESMEILNAYLLPGREQGLYADITPVNTFRLIFNEFFGGEYALLDDASYYSPSVLQTYDFLEIPNRCGSEE